MMLVEPGKRNIRQRTAFAIEDCELAFLSKSNADKIAEQHPEMLTSFQNLASRKACVEHERLNMSDQNALFICPVALVQVSQASLKRVVAEQDDQRGCE